jgi:hypothetical protein
MTIERLTICDFMEARSQTTYGQTLPVIHGRTVNSTLVVPFRRCKLSADAAVVLEHITSRLPQNTADRGYAASLEQAMADFKARWVART